MKKLGLILLIISIAYGSISCVSKKVETVDDYIDISEEVLIKKASIMNRNEKTLVMNLGGDIDTVDPGIAVDIDSLHIINNVFEGLFRDVGGELQHAMAATYEVSEDGLTYTFYLREGVKWSDGKPVTAHDFEYGWKRNLKLAKHSVFRNLLLDSNYEECKALGDRIFRVTLKKPTDQFVRMTTEMVFMPLRQDVFEDSKKQSLEVDRDGMVYNGPYMFVDYFPGVEILLVKNPYYWDSEHVRIHRVQAKIIRDPSIALTAYEAGALMLNMHMPAEEVPRLLEEDLTFKVEVRLGTYFLNLYNQTEALSDARVRKAMSLVIDRNAICDLVAGGNIPTTELVAPNASKGIGRNNDYDSPSKEDIKNARRLLAEAGYPNGAGMPVLEYITDYGEKHVRIAQGIQEMWKKHLGIEIEIANMEWASFQERKRTQDYDVARGGWIGDYNDPYAFLGVFETGNPSNLTKYHNPEYDDLLSEASSLKGEERYSALEKAEDALLEDGGVIPIFNYVDYIQYADDIEGISRTATGYLYFGDAYFK